MNRPTIVCLCGSTKFQEAFQKANLQETLKGKIVLSVGAFMHAEKIELTEEDKHRLDELHLRKIDLADEVLCINVDDYVGDSTKRELWHTQNQNKPIRFWEPSRFTNEHIKRWFVSWSDWVSAAKKASIINSASSAR